MTNSRDRVTYRGLDTTTGWNYTLAASPSVLLPIKCWGRMKPNLKSAGNVVALIQIPNVVCLKDVFQPSGGQVLYKTLRIAGHESKQSSYSPLLNSFEIPYHISKWCVSPSFSSSLLLSSCQCQCLLPVSTLHVPSSAPPLLIAALARHASQ